MNLETGEFYFGYRSHNVTKNRTINEDLGVKYFSSNDRINEDPTKFKFSVVCVCPSPDYAYELEQRLIKQYWGNPKLMNKHVVDMDIAKRHFRCTGHTEETKRKISTSSRGKIISEETKTKMSENALKRPQVYYDKFREASKQANTGRVHSENERTKRSASLRNTFAGRNPREGMRWFTDGKTNKLCHPVDAPVGWSIGRTTGFNKYLIRDPIGKILETNNLERFCRECDVKLDPSTLLVTLNTKYKHKGFSLIEKSKKGVS